MRNETTSLSNGADTRMDDLKSRLEQLQSQVEILQGTIYDKEKSDQWTAKP